MINLQCLELPISRTNFHGPKDVRAIELYAVKDVEKNSILPLSTVDCEAVYFRCYHITAVASNNREVVVIY